MNQCRIRLTLLFLLVGVGGLYGCSAVLTPSTTSQSMTIGPAASAQLAVAGYAIDQEMTSCPPSSVPRPNDPRHSGIACRFPNKSQTVFGVLVDQLSLAADHLGKIEGILVTGLDAAQAAAGATKEYGAPDAAEVNERLSTWGWIRGKVRLVIFHYSGDQASSSILLDRYPR